MLKLPLNLNLMRSLDVLLETRNLTAAAKLLGITQSAMSRQFAQLRIDLDDPLLVREGQRYLLTQRADALRVPLREALTNMISIFEVPQFEPGFCKREFSICGSDYIADNMLPELVRIIRPLAPDVKISFRIWEAGHYRLLADEGVDLVPTIANEIPDNLHGRSMGEDQSVCLMRADHPLAKQSLTLEDYVHFPHVRIGSGGDKDSFVDRYLSKQGVVRDVRLTVPFYASALRIVMQNDFLLTIPEHIAVVMARQNSLIWKPLPFESQVHRYWLLWHARCHHDPAHKWFRDQVFAVLYQSMHGVTQFNLG